MPEIAVEKKVCDKCGVDVRDDTLFCYNCGNRVASETEPAPAKLNGTVKNSESSRALDDLAAKLRSSDRAGAGTTAIAAKTRRSRISGVKGSIEVWEPASSAAGTGLLVGSLVVAFITLVIVFFTVVWK